MTTRTINLPVTAKFDGCFCSDECTHYRLDEEGYQDCGIVPEDVDSVQGRPFVDLGDIIVHHQLNSLRYHLSLVRTRWCCDTFGMGEEQDAQPDKTTHRCALCGRERDYELRKYALCSHCEPDECDEQPEATEHEIWTNIDGTTVYLTQNAIDNECELETMDAMDAEALRRWTSE